MAETEDLGMTSEDQLEALDAMENGQEVDATDGADGDVTAINNAVIEDQVSNPYYTR